MEHLAILKGKWLAKILSGEKTIESRWYKLKKTPYENIKKGDVVYLKEAGKPVTAKATAGKVLFFDGLDDEKIKEILGKYGKEIGLEESDTEYFGGKSFCTLVFLEDVKGIRPFHADKRGHGMMAAWITVDSINRVKA